jgi:hypothetical protein
MRVLPCRSGLLVITEVQVPLVISDAQVRLLVIIDVQVPLVIADVQATIECRSSKCGSCTRVLDFLVARFQGAGPCWGRLPS